MGKNSSGGPLRVRNPLVRAEILAEGIGVKRVQNGIEAFAYNLWRNAPKGRWRHVRYPPLSRKNKSPRGGLLLAGQRG
jgi:hypothetical protein